MWLRYTGNPTQNITRDCAIRAVAVALDISWEKSFTLLAAMAFQMGEVLDSDLVSGAVLRQHGFTRHLAPECEGCYTVKQFCKKYPRGTYVLKTDGHVVAAVDGDYIDVWDSGNEPVLYYWKKEN